MDATQKTGLTGADNGPLKVQQKIDKFGRLCAACLGWSSKQSRSTQGGDCTLTGFLNCQRLALQLYLVSERVISGVVLCDAHEGFDKHIMPILESCDAAITRMPTEVGWLVSPGGHDALPAPSTSYAEGCDGACRKSSEGAVHWVCTSENLEIVLWKPRAADANSPERVGVKNMADAIPVYFKILSAFRTALAPLGLDVHIRVG